MQSMFGSKNYFAKVICWGQRTVSTVGGISPDVPS
jgi:hypothetical protein